MSTIVKVIHKVSGTMPNYYRASDSAIEFDTEQNHGDGCKCCTPKHVVEENERRWAQRWKELQKQKRALKRKEKSATGNSYEKRWYNEHEKFEDLLWRYY